LFVTRFVQKKIPEQSQNPPLNFLQALCGSHLEAKIRLGPKRNRTRIDFFGLTQGVKIVLCSVLYGVYDI
jgi:hypothetical protein